MSKRAYPIEGRPRVALLVCSSRRFAALKLSLAAPTLKGSGISSGVPSLWFYQLEYGSAPSPGSGAALCSWRRLMR